MFFDSIYGVINGNGWWVGSVVYIFVCKEIVGDSGIVCGFEMDGLDCYIFVMVEVVGFVG